MRLPLKNHQELFNHHFSFNTFVISQPSCLHHDHLCEKNKLHHNMNSYEHLTLQLQLMFHFIFEF